MTEVANNLVNQSPNDMKLNGETLEEPMEVDEIDESLPLSLSTKTVISCQDANNKDTRSGEMKISDDTEGNPKPEGRSAKCNDEQDDEKLSNKKDAEKPDEQNSPGNSEGKSGADSSNAASNKLPNGQCSNEGTTMAKKGEVGKEGKKDNKREAEELDCAKERLEANNTECNPIPSEEMLDLESDSGEGVVGKSSSSSSSTKKGGGGKKSSLQITPRRSTRNLNKQKSYAEKDDFVEIERVKSVGCKMVANNNNEDENEDDDDVVEVVPSDPFSDVNSPKKTLLPPPPQHRPIVVNDPKGLTELSVTTNRSSSSKRKEPTLVIIDTNSILSGRGPIPVPQPNIPASLSLSMSPVVHNNNNNNNGGGVNLQQHNHHFNLKPPPQMKPIILGGSNATIVPVVPSKPPPVILPSLTDDMYVVEAPSFIVPYVYEKPPEKILKTFVEALPKNNECGKEEEEKEKEGKKCEGDEGEEEAAAKMDIDIKDNDKKSDSEKKKEDDKSDDADKSGEAGEKKDADGKKDEADAGKKEESGDKKVVETAAKGSSSLSLSFFDQPLGKFFVQIGLNFVQEHVQTDLLKSQRRKRDKEGGGSKCGPEVQMAIDALTKTLEASKETNDPFKMDVKKCELCSFKTESTLAMAHHLETPHMKNYTYRCNFCHVEVRSPHDILYHMEAEHNIRGRLERAPAFHQCPNCPFEDNQKGKLTRHLASCQKKYRPEKNQEPPLDWEPPAKIPRVTRNRPANMSAAGNAAVYQAAMSGLKSVQQQTNTLLPKLLPNTAAGQAAVQNILSGRGGKGSRANGAMPYMNTSGKFPAANFPGFLYNKNTGNLSQNYQMAGAQLYQIPSSKSVGQQQNMRSLSKVPPLKRIDDGRKLVDQVKAASNQANNVAAKFLNQPSISITPLPRSGSGGSGSGSGGASSSSLASITKTSKSAQSNSSNSNNKNSFVVCEICDGYIKDLEQLRDHMQWIHKVKIHPKMIYNRPPLNCQKCQFRFFTDQGLERHLLGSHGLVTSSMQEAANKGKDGGRCPVCGRVYQWKLLNHVARDHNMVLKPAHLSYKCTVCTATFSMYKQFESHVYSAHSVVAKRYEGGGGKKSSAAQKESSLKPLKINDEITIIPQPPRPAATKSRTSNKKASSSLDTGAIDLTRKSTTATSAASLSSSSSAASSAAALSAAAATAANYEAAMRMVAGETRGGGGGSLGFKEFLEEYMRRNPSMAHTWESANLNQFLINNCDAYGGGGGSGSGKSAGDKNNKKDKNYKRDEESD